MRLYLVRHGDAVSAGVDPARPLSEEGERDVRRVASFIAPLGLRPVAVWHSGKTRAEQTARILCEALAVPVEPVEKEGIDGGDPVVPIADEIRVRDEDVMLVGHLPFVGRLASLLLVECDAMDILAFHAGSAACIVRAPDGSWYLEWMVTPDCAAAACPT